MTNPRLLTGNAEAIVNDGSVPMSGPFAMRGNRITGLGAPLSPTDAARLMDAGGGGTGVGEFIHADFGTQDEAQGRYVGTQGWIDLMAKLATLQLGAAPRVRCAYLGTPFVVPSTGMPPNGWDMRGGVLTSFYGSTGSVVLDIPPGVKLDNLFGIGSGAIGGEGAIVLKIAPPPGDSVLNFSALPPSAPWIFQIAGGCGVDHSTDTGRLIKGDDTFRTIVLSAFQPQQNTGIFPPAVAPLVQAGNTDSLVLVQMGFNGLPNDVADGGGPGSALVMIFDASSNPDSGDIPTFLPNWTGGGGVFSFTSVYPQLVNYTPLNSGDWNGDPTNIRDALDRIAAAVAGLLGGPIP